MVFINLALSVSVVFLMRYVQNLLNSDVKINLVEIVTQNKDAITSRLMMNVNSLDITANKLSDRLKAEESSGKLKTQDLIEQYAKENNTDDLFTANRDGMALFDGGRKLDISGRHYFRLAIDGIPNISDKLISRINGDEVFVISVPLSYNGEIVGTIQKVITFEEMYKICSLSIFSSQGYMYVINREGYVILHSAHPKCEQKSDNYFRDLYGAGNPKASEQMKRDIRNNRNGFIETTIAGREIFSAYTPIEKIHDWYLITSVPNNAVSPNGNTVISIFYFILFVIVVIFTSSLTYFLWYKNKQRAQLEKIAFVDTVTLGDTYNKFLVDAQGILTQCPHKKFHIIKFDIDNFKYINNFYGFEFGDRILRKINESISQQLNVHEQIARIYSDHFVLLLENAAEGRLNALLSSIENEEITLYFSAGIYSVTDSTESINLMVDKAGTAARLHYELQSNSVTIKAGELASSVKIKGFYDNFEDMDSLGINLRLVAPQDKIWDIYGDETKVQLVKICPFDIQRFVGYAKVTSNFFADYMQNTSFRLVTVEQDPEKGNGVIINDFFLDGMDLKISFNTQKPLEPKVEMETDRKSVV